MAEERRGTVAIAVVVLCLAGAGFLFWRAMAGNEIVPETMVAHCACLACQADVRIEHPATEAAPYPCPECGERAAYHWHYCYDCMERFVPQPFPREPGGIPRPPVQISCPTCGGGNVSVYVPELLAGEPVEDAPLPTWNP
jgi:predicted RNA-binding Zn-ribbon protein involved in translation (DUF1610 family)